MAETKKKKAPGRETKTTTKKAPGKAASKKAIAAKPARPDKPKADQPALAAQSAGTEEPQEKRPASRGTRAGDLRGMIRIKLVRSLIGSTPHQRAVAAGLGLRRLNQAVERMDTKEIRGMVAKVPHLVRILG
jgi:large subunit ribosomal protein L30